MATTKIKVGDRIVTKPNNHSCPVGLRGTVIGFSEIGSVKFLDDGDLACSRPVPWYVPPENVVRLVRRKKARK